MIPLVFILLISQTEEEPGGARIDETEADRSMEDIEEAESPEIPAAFTSTAAAAKAAAGCPPAAEAHYNQGFDDLIEGDGESAYAMFARVLDLCPMHPYAAEMGRLALAMPPKKGGSSVLRRLDPKAAETTRAVTGFEPEKPSLLARAELVTFQSIHGLVDGFAVCAAMECDDGRALVGLAFLGTALTGGLSFALSSEIRSGQALAINSGTGWGGWHAAILAGITEPRDDGVIPGMLIAGNLLGTSVGVLIAAGLKPLNGQVSFVNSTAIWFNVMSTFMVNIARIDPLEDDEFWIAQLISTDLGLVVGGLVASKLQISRGRVLLVDAGGIGGLLLGLGIAVLAEESPEEELVGAMGLIGTALGIGTTFYLTRNIDAPEVVEEITLIPGGPRGSFGGTLAVAF